MSTDLSTERLAEWQKWATDQPGIWTVAVEQLIAEIHTLRAKIEAAEAEQHCDSLCELDARRIERVKAAEAELRRLRDGVSELVDELGHPDHGEVTRRFCPDCGRADRMAALLAPQVQDKPEAETCEP